VPEYSTDFADWIPMTGSPQLTAIDETWERVLWPLIPGMPQIFCRLRLLRP
jgi:hypothetical protein